MENLTTGLISDLVIAIVIFFVLKRFRSGKIFYYIFLGTLCANFQGMFWIYFENPLYQYGSLVLLMLIGIPVFVKGFKGIEQFYVNVRSISSGNMDIRKSEFYMFKEVEESLIENFQFRESLAQQNASAVQQLGSTAKELQTTMDEQSTSIAEQSSALNQTASTVQELGVTSGQTTEKANLVLQSAERTMEITSESHKAFKNTVESMLDIRLKVERIAVQILELSSQTQKIGSIITTVDEIAETTNLLALNASIEASKAGESGRGFQVVAAEIRKLAEQSKRSVAQIATIISEIQNATNSTVMATEEGTKGVDLGVELINKAGSIMEESVSSLEDNLNAAQQILAANKQQMIGIEQITQAISNVNVVIKQISVGTNQTKEAIKTLNTISYELENK